MGISTVPSLTIAGTIEPDQAALLTILNLGPEVDCDVSLKRREPEPRPTPKHLKLASGQRATIRLNATRAALQSRRGQDEPIIATVTTDTEPASLLVTLEVRGPPDRNPVFSSSTQLIALGAARIKRGAR